MKQIVTRDPCALLLKFSRKTLKWYVFQFTQGLQSGDKYFKTSSLNLNEMKLVQLRGV